MRVFITGATGFIGSWVALRLLHSGHELVALARNREKFPSLFERPNIECLETSLDDSKAIRRALQGCDACIHIALGWGESASEMLLSDTKWSVKLLQAAEAAGVERFIYTSSIAAYGPFSGEMTEETPTRPDNLYGATKAATEAFVLSMGATSKMRCNVIRPGYTFGNPVLEDGHSQPDRRFYELSESALRGEELEFKRDDGTQFIWAGHLAQMYEAVLMSENNRQIYLGLTDHFTPWGEIYAQCVSAACTQGRVLWGDDVALTYRFNLDRVESHFGFRFDSAQAMKDHIGWCVRRATVAQSRA